jgi:hypothetical protein
MVAENYPKPLKHLIHRFKKPNKTHRHKPEEEGSKEGY